MTRARVVVERSIKSATVGEAFDGNIEGVSHLKDVYPLSILGYFLLGNIFCQIRIKQKK